MCAAPAQRKDRKGAATWRVRLVAAAIVVSLVSLWFYQPKEELQSPPEGVHQSDTLDRRGGIGKFGKYGSTTRAPKAAVPNEQTQAGSATGAVSGSATGAVSGAATGAVSGAATGAVSGAALVVIVQLLYWLGSKLAPRAPVSGSAAKAASKGRKTLAADMGALLRSGHSSDLTFTVGDSQLRAHRAVLVARSPVFAAMMAHDCLEASSGRIAVTDVEADVIQQLLEFLYTDEVQLDDPQMAQKLLAAADKYQLPTLKEQCEFVISRNLTVENAAACAVLASQHSCSCLRESAARFIAAHFKEVMATVGWAEAVRKHPDHVVEVSRLVAAAATESR